MYHVYGGFFCEFRAPVSARRLPSMAWAHSNLVDKNQNNLIFFNLSVSLTPPYKLVIVAGSPDLPLYIL
jgi:hypothetical protein